MPAPSRATRPRPRIHIVREGWRQARRNHHLQRHTQLATALNVSETTIWRVLTREVQRPGEEFIAASLDLFSDMDFKDLYVVRRGS